MHCTGKIGNSTVEPRLAKVEETFGKAFGVKAPLLPLCSRTTLLERDPTLALVGPGLVGRLCSALGCSLVPLVLYFCRARRVVRSL